MSVTMNKSWMSQSRTSDEYIDGVRMFINFVKDMNKDRTLFSCPCVKCRNGRGNISLDDISYYLLKFGIDQSYITWFAHGETTVISSEQPPKTKFNDELDGQCQEMEDLVNDAFRSIDGDIDAFIEDVRRNDHEIEGDILPEEDPQNKPHESLLQDAKQPLYPSCPRKCTKLLTIVELYNIKVRHGWSDSSFDEILQLVKKLLPEENTLPESTYKAKKMIKSLGMDYEMIHACQNDCILYWKEYENLERCPICRSSRWKLEYLNRKQPKKVPVKVLRYFDIIPRLKRLYSVPWIAEKMTCHFRATTSTEVMRHPIDSPTWIGANSAWPDFAKEPRNVRFGLATDGFNPFGNRTGTYSCWPVIIVPYNLPPSYCMRTEFSMLTLLIPGPKCPGKDIDVYLQPLVAELKELRHNGVSTYDSHSKEIFNLKAMLLWAILDFPAYGSLSGCITHGKYACPICAEGTYSERLHDSKKHVYPGNRRGLPTNHEFRTQTTSFNNKVEHGRFPARLSGKEVKEKVQDIHMRFGKTQENKRKLHEAAELENITAWYKKSILFELEYWEDMKVRHNLDVMHIEKNVTDHLLSTILDVKEKTKDATSSRKDLKRLKIRKKLWLRQEGDKTIKPKAPFTLSREEKKLFCQTLHDLKVPKGYSSNWKLRVNMENVEISGLKSHDHHVIMQQLFPVLLQHAFSKHKALRNAVRDICKFFSVLCSKEILVEDLIIAKNRLIEAMCVLEKYFPPSFFVISVHLMVFGHTSFCYCFLLHWLCSFADPRDAKDAIRDVIATSLMDCV